MRRFLGAVTVLSLVLSGAGQARAANVLYFVDGNNGTDQMALALAKVPGLVVTQVSDPAVFDTLLKATPNAWNLAVFSAQEAYGPNYTSALADLASYVQGTLPTQLGKGKAIVDSWFTPAGGDITPFGATPTGDINGPAVNMSALNTTPQTITNPIALTNPVPPYATFSTGENLSLSPGAVGAGTFFDPGNASGTNGETAVAVGNPDAGVVAGGDSIVNGFLNDVASTLDPGGSGISQGEQLYINEITALLTPTSSTTPEPATLTLLGAGIVGLFGYSRVRRRKTAIA